MPPKNPPPLLDARGDLAFGVALGGIRGLDDLELLVGVARAKLARLLGVMKLELDEVEFELLGVLIQPNMLDLLAGFEIAGAPIPARSIGGAVFCDD